MSRPLRSIALAATIAAITACGAETTEERLARATTAIEGGDYTAAVIELKNTLKEDNTSAQARWMLGSLYLQSGDVLSAEKELRRARSLGWDSNDVQPAIAQVLLAQSSYAELRELDDEGLGNDARAQVLAIKAVAELAQDERAIAERLLSQAESLAPESNPVRITRARLQAASGDLEAAAATIDGVLASTDPHAGALGLRGDISMAQKDAEGAIDFYSQAIDQGQDVFSNLLKRSLLALQSGQLELAGKDAAELLRLSPRHPGGNYVQGLLLFGEQKYPEAITSLSLAEPAFTQFPMVLFYLGSAHMIEGNTSQAAAFASHFYDVAPTNIAGRKLLATLRIEQGKFEEAIELLEPVLANDPEDVGTLNLMANAKLRSGSTDEGISLLAEIARLEPESAAAQVRLGAGMLLDGQDNAAQKHIEAAIELDPKFQQADILLVLNHLQKGDMDAAIDSAKAFRRRNPGQVTPHNLLGRVYLASGDTAAAEGSFKRALKLDAGDPAANHNLAQLAVREDDLDTATAYYQTILESREDFLPALMQLARLADRAGDQERMVAYLRQGADAQPNALQPRVALARHFLATGQPENVPPLFSTMDDVRQRDPEVLRLVAMAQLSDSDHEQAQITLDKLAEEEPATPETQHMRAMAAARSEDETATVEALNRALELDDNFVPSRMALARLALSQGDDEALNRHLEKLVEVAPEQTDVILLQARAELRAGNRDAALGHARTAHAQAPGTNTTVVLAEYLEAAGEREEAVALLEEWTAAHPQDFMALMALANSAQVAGENQRALELYEDIVKLTEDNVVALNNLAWHLRKTDSERALAYIRRADDMAPNTPAILDTKAMVEYHAGEFRQAERSITRALQKEQNPSMLYHKGMIELALEDTDAAVETLKQLVQSDAQFPERADAEALLASLQ